MTVKEYHHRGLKQALLKKSLEIITGEGLPKLSFRRLAKELDVSAMAAYRHFDNKEVLLQKLAKQGFNELQESLDEVQFDDSVEQLIKQGQNYVNFAVKNPTLYSLMFSSQDLGEWCAELVQASDQAFASLFSTVAKIQQDGVLDNKLQVPEVTLSCWCHVHGIAELFLNSRLPDSINPDDFTVKSCSNLINGIISK